MAYVVKYKRYGKEGTSPRIFRTKVQAKKAVQTMKKMQSGKGRIKNDLGYRNMRVKKI